MFARSNAAAFQYGTSTTPAQGIGAAPVQGANAALAVPAYYLPYQRAPHAHAIHLAGSPQIARQDGHLSTHNSPWVSRRHPEMGPAAPTLQHGLYRPSPQQHGQRLLTSCPTSNNWATNQGQYFWDSEKRHCQSECLKAAATNAVRPETLEPYAEYGYLTDQPYHGSVKHLGRNPPWPPWPHCNASEGFYRPNPAKGRGQQPRIRIQSRPPGHRIQVSEKVRPPADFTQYHADGTDTLAADIADARHGPTLQD